MSIHNEQVKLAANAVNAAAVGLLGAGLLTPTIATTYHLPGYTFDIEAGIRLAIWTLSAVLLHLIASLILTNLEAG